MFTHFTLRCSVIFNNRLLLRAFTLCGGGGGGVPYFDNAYLPVGLPSLSFILLAKCCTPGSKRTGLFQ